MRTIGSLRVLRARCDPHVRIRELKDIREHPEDAYFVYLPMQGDLHVESADRRRFLVRAGTPCLLHPMVSTRLTLPQHVEHVAVRIPRNALAPLLANPERRGHELLTSEGIPDLLQAFSRFFVASPDLVADHGKMLSGSFCSLLAMAIGANPDAREAARSSVAEAKLERALGLIDLHLYDSGLCPATVAQQVGVSVRYLHRLLETTGRSFSKVVLEKRLALCRSALGDAALRQRSIAEIAFAHGFADLSHFNRSFKRAYGLTPRDLRASCRTLVFNCIG